MAASDYRRRSNAIGFPAKVGTQLGAVLLALAELANRGELRGERGGFCLDPREFLLALGGALCFLGALERFECLRFVEIVGTDRGVGENGDDLRLDFKHAAGDEDQFLLAAPCWLDAHLARLDA